MKLMMKIRIINMIITFSVGLPAIQDLVLSAENVTKQAVMQ